MLPLKQIARQVTLASALLLPVCGFGTAFAASPGGEGVFTGPFSTCFKTGQDKVTEVCGPYEIRWKLWTLVGEPVGSFVVKWDAKEVRIVDPAPRKGSTLYAIGGRVISGELAEAANKSELYIEASVSVTGGAVQLSPVDLAFDTGVAVRSGKGASMNVPGSWNWDKFLLKAGVLGTSPCNKKAPQYISEQNAKAIMKDGNVQLLNIKLCPGTQVNASALESAIDALCRDDNSVNTSLCAKKPQAEKDKEKVQPSVIEDAFAKLDKADTKKLGNKPATIEDAFTKMEAERAAAIQAALVERDRRAAEERKMREENARLAAENAKNRDTQPRKVEDVSGGRWELISEEGGLRWLLYKPLTKQEPLRLFDWAAAHKACDGEPYGAKRRLPNDWDWHYKVKEDRRDALERQIFAHINHLPGYTFGVGRNGTETRGVWLGRRETAKIFYDDGGTSTSSLPATYPLVCVE